MATIYSSLYGYPAGRENDSTAPRNYKGPSGPMTANGGAFVVRGTVTIASGETLGAADVAAMCVVPEGTKLVRIAIVPSADLNAGNDFTFNLGWASAANEHASASTGLQGTAAFALTAAETISDAAAASGDTLQLTGVAGELAAGTLSFVAEFSS